MNNQINGTHERALGVVDNNYKSSFDELRPKGNSFKIHHGNLQKLTVDIFKVKLDHGLYRPWLAQHWH